MLKTTAFRYSETLCEAIYYYIFERVEMSTVLRFIRPGTRSPRIIKMIFVLNTRIPFERDRISIWARVYTKWKSNLVSGNYVLDVVSSRDDLLCIPFVIT